MSDTINIGGITVSKFYLGGSSDVKIYLGTTKLYPHLQEPCFAVVDNISTYTARTYVDVYETSSDKWYKLNNLGNYEEYGIYGSGRTITYYEGKLTIDGDYEYQYSGSSWVNVGEISGDTHDYSQYYLTLQALESGTIGFSAGTVDYSTDSGSTWNTLAQGNTISVSQGDEVLFKKSGSIPTENYGIGTFTSSCRFNVYGNIMSMQEGDNFATATTIANYEFYFKRLFAESKVVSAENMVLPATTLRKFCYNELFKGSTYLTTPPKVFPATALTQDCYSQSYNGCTSLTKSPVLPALTAARASYGWMFPNCTSLSEVTCLATDVSADYATYDWLSNVASSGTFYKNPNASWSRGTNGIPSGWNVEDYVEPSPLVYPVYYDEIQDPPNNVTFTSMTEAESYECPWVGMRATIAGSAYTFTSGYTWEYIDTPVLPDVPFVLNYNAKTYSSSTQSMSYTDGQLNTVNAVKQYGAAVVDHSEDGYISVTGNTRFVTTGGTVGIGRNNTQTGCTMTIVSKARTTNAQPILTSRGGTSGSEMNWMWRYPTDGIFLHGSSSYNTKLYTVDTTVSPIIASVKTYYDGGVKQILKDWTNDGGYSGNFGYGGYYDGGSMFCDYLTFNNEFWKGDFYWVYMSQEVLTDEQIQQVINYNENLIV